MTTTKHTILALLLVLKLPGVVAQAQSEFPSAHLKKSDPNDLYVAVRQEGNCELTYGNVVDEVLDRYRVTPLPCTFTDELGLSIVVRCLSLIPHPGLSFFVEAKFARLVPAVDSQPGEAEVILIYYASEYERLGVVHDNSTGEQEVTDAIREVVDEALSDYRKANGDY
jgi:hypothetical protein